MNKEQNTNLNKDVQDYTGLLSADVHPEGVTDSIFDTTEKPYMAAPVIISSRFIPVEDWCGIREGYKLIGYNVPECDQVFKQEKGYITAPILESDTCMTNHINMFGMYGKRAYNSDQMREHLVHYLNYFTKFYDPEKELVGAYRVIKTMIDFDCTYNKNEFISNINKIILNGSIADKVRKMNRANYSRDMHYRIVKSPALTYTDKETMTLMEISLFMKIIIPLASHFIYVNNANMNMQDSKSLLLEIFHLMIDEDPITYNKLYALAIEMVEAEDNLPAITGDEPCSYEDTLVENIILHTMPKYKYDINLIKINQASIATNIKFRVLNLQSQYNISREIIGGI